METTTTVGQFFSLFFLFGGILFILIFMMFYAKWQIYGPRWHNFVAKANAYFKNKFDKTKPKVQKGAIIENTSMKDDLDKKELEASNAQELLSIQNERIRQDKQVKKLQFEIDEKRTKKEDKVNEKIERKELKVEQKEMSSKAKEENKEKKKAYKETKKEEKNKTKSETDIEEKE